MFGSKSRCLVRRPGHIVLNLDDRIPVGILQRRRRGDEVTGLFLQSRKVLGHIVDERNHCRIDGLGIGHDALCGAGDGLGTHPGLAHCHRRLGRCRIGVRQCGIYLVDGCGGVANGLGRPQDLGVHLIDAVVKGFHAGVECC